MSSVGQGGTKRLEIQFHAYEGGPLTDPDDVTLEIRLGEDVVAGPFTVDIDQIERLSLGSYRYDWDVPVDAELGTYEARWAGTISDAQVVGEEFFDVIEAGAANTAIEGLSVSVDETKTLTGVTLATSDIFRAQALVEMYAKCDLSNLGAYGPRDRRWLVRGVAYQAAWMDSHPEVFATMDVGSLSQVGMSVSFRSDRNAAFMAPLARRALHNLSWMRSRSVTIKSKVASASDDHAWEAL